MATAQKRCDSCDNETVEALCTDCEQQFCSNCTRFHTKSKATRNHNLYDTSNQDEDLSKSDQTEMCGNDCNEVAICVCIDCKQLLCETCKIPHSRQKATQHHVIFAIKKIKRDDSESTSSDLQTRDIRRSSIASNAQVKIGKGEYSGNYSNEIMTSAPGDKEVTRVRGIAILTDGRIIIADYKNQNLKMYGSNFKFVNARDLKDDPRGMAATSNDLVAITIADKKEIRLFRFENKIRSHSSHKVKDKPFSIAYNKDFFVVEHGEGEDGVIRIYDKNFREKFNIPGNQRIFGQFTGNTIRLALDVTKRNIYVTDIAKDQIHCVSFKDNGNWSISWTVKVDSPRGIVHVDDTLFVASSSNNRILQLNDADGFVFSMLDEDDRVKRPRYIAYQPKLKKLAVEIDGNHVKLYNISQIITDKDACK